MSLIPEIPAAPFVPLYPALGSLNFNQEAYAYGTAMPGVTTRLREIAAACRECALAAREDAMSAEASRMLSAQQADQAMSYRNQAANSATAAAGSASTASTHASNAVGAYTQMQALYLGAKTSNPVKDNQGNALQLGAWYTYVGTDPAFKGVWLWWDGTGWNPGIGPVVGTLMPKSGGKFTGYASGPAGATGEQFPQAQEVVMKVPEAWGKEKLMGDLGVGYALLTTGAGRGADWPVEGYDEAFQAWDVTTTGIPSRMVQVATQVFTTNVYARTQGSTWMRCRHDATWGAWSRVITDTTAMGKQITVNQPAGTPTYTVDPAMGGVHVVTINATCQFILPVGRQYGDEVTLHVVSAGAIRAITFSANVGLPIDGTGALLPFPAYPANGMVSLIFTCNRVNRWECFYAGVH
jgi:hypothetical protein